MDAQDDVLAAGNEARLKQPQRVADVAVIGRRGLRRRRCRKAMGVVIVVDGNRITVRIVATRMAPVERAATDDDRKEGGESATDETFTRGAQEHQAPNVAAPCGQVNETEGTESSQLPDWISTCAAA